MNIIDSFEQFIDYCHYYVYFSVGSLILLLLINFTVLLKHSRLKKENKIIRNQNEKIQEDLKLLIVALSHRGEKRNE